ncbi:hypothetical protein GT019_28910 [Paenibacillus sp. T1]|uniref:Barstar (barnase inhibitor) domain-containing protein n=2 Tax=Paenibacillus glycinis TaxID=2697035 RepID=A0ABW9XZH8_9BACL|nr:hypothetical protein [Paenibacillus glycinis]
MRNDEKCYSLLTLHSFTLSEVCRVMPKIIFSNFYLNFLSKDGTSLGGYYFSPDQMVKINPLELSEETPITIGGYFGEEPLPLANKVWDQLRENPNAYGQWKKLEEKRAWLQIVRLRRLMDDTMRKDQVVRIDGKYIQDEVTLYLALGEAVNGPFGYYGANLDSLSDCLSGGFGLVPPFTLEWTDFHYSFKSKPENHARCISLLFQILTSRGCKILLTD